MESIQNVSKLEIKSDEIIYDKKSKILSVYILDFIFVGYYKKSTKVGKMLDDLYASLKDIILERKNIYILDFKTLNPISELIKLKSLKLIKKPEKIEAEKQKPGILEKKDLDLNKQAIYDEEKAFQQRDFEDLSLKRKKEKKSEEREETRRILKSAPPPSGPPVRAPSAPTSGAPTASKTSLKDSFSDIDDVLEAEEDIDMSSIKKKEDLSPLEEAISSETHQPITYDINMGLQYYSVMMERCSYLFYVYLSHEELKIVDEEDKVIYKTTFKITTTKKEPPILDLRIEGEGFEVHPLSGKVVVKKEAINPPLMIFSILPTKEKKKKKRKKKEERRFLHVVIDFEEKAISHTVLSIIVQPKHFHLDIGPIQLDISKTTAMLISFFSVLIATISFIYSIFTFESSSITEMVSGFVPGLASVLFFITFAVTLIKEGFYPLKQKWSSLLNFDKTSLIMK